jgi:hypothetical protein
MTHFKSMTESQPTNHHDPGQTTCIHKSESSVVTPDPCI